MNNTEKATEFLQKFSEWIHDANLLGYVFKWISGSWIKGLYKLSVGVEDILDQVFDVFGFLNNGTIKTVYTSMRVLSVTVLIIMLIVLAYKFILNERVDLKAGLFRAALFVCLGINLPAMMNSSVELAQKVYGETKNLNDSETSTLSYGIVKENLADLKYASKKGFGRLNGQTGTAKSNLSEKGFQATDLTEIITPDDLKLMKEKARNEDDVSYLEYKLTTDEEGAITSEKISNGGMFDFFKEGKFRFTFKTGTITVSLITVSFAFLCSAFIIATSLIELIFAKLMFPILSVSDIETGQRTKKMFLDMGSSLLAIMLTGFSLSIFKLYFAYIGTLHIGFLAYLILCIVGIRITIDGPNFFGKFLGIDIGVRSGWQALMGTAVAAKAATGAMKNGVNAAKSIKDGASNTMSRMKVNNGVHENNNNDKSIQNQSKNAMNQQSSRSGLQSLVSNVRQAFGAEDQMDPETESNGSARSSISTQAKNETSIAQNSGEGNSSTETDSLSQMNAETPGLSSTTKPSVSNGISSDPSLSPNGQGKSIRSMSPNDLNKMGENGQRSALKNEAVSKAGNGVTSAGNVAENQKNQRSTIPSVQSPERKEAIKAAADKVNQNQEATGNESAEAHVSLNRTNDQEAIQNPSEVTYGDSKDQISDSETKGSQMIGQSSPGYTPGNVSHQESNSVTGRSSSVLTTGNNKLTSAGGSSQEATQKAPTSGSTINERHSSPSMSAGSVTNVASSPTPQSVSNQAIDRTVVSAPNRPASSGNKVAQETVHAPQSGSVTVERQSSRSSSAGSTTSYLTSQSVHQAPSQAIDRTVVSTSNRPTSGGNKIVQETVQAPADHRTKKEKVVRQKAHEKPTHDTIIETKHKEAASPAELAKKYLKDSGVSPENAFFDSYESINRIKADDYI